MSEMVPESTDSDDYTHVDPSEFEDFDRVDSMTIPPVSE